MLVNKGAIDHVGNCSTFPEGEVRDLETASFAAVACRQPAGRAMRDAGHGGPITDVISRLASIGMPTLAVYSVTKGAILAFTRGGATGGRGNPARADHGTAGRRCRSLKPSQPRSRVHHGRHPAGPRRLPRPVTVGGMVLGDAPAAASATSDPGCTDKPRRPSTHG